MPNWTTNRMVVSGKECDADGSQRGTWRDFGTRTKPVVDEEEPFLSYYIPKDPRCSKPVSSGIQVFTTMKDDGFDGYNWCLNNWGCKWPDGNTTLEIRQRSVLMGFITPWGGPATGVTTISLQFPLAKFKLDSYNEGGWDSDHWLIQDGKVLKYESKAAA